MSGVQVCFLYGCVCMFVFVWEARVKGRNGPYVPFSLCVYMCWSCMCGSVTCMFCAWMPYSQGERARVYVPMAGGDGMDAIEALEVMPKPATLTHKHTHTSIHPFIH